MGARRQTRDRLFLVHEKWYELETSKVDIDICIVENVTEYSESIIKKHFQEPKYKIVAERIDPRVFGEASARARLYAIVYKTSKFFWDPSLSLSSFLSMLKMRPQMTAKSFFFMPNPKSTLTTSQACKQSVCLQHWFHMMEEQIPCVNIFLAFLGSPCLPG